MLNFEDKRSAFLKKFKDRLLIEKSCAAFLKLATRNLSIDELPTFPLHPIKTAEKFIFATDGYHTMNQDVAGESVKDFMNRCWNCDVNRPKLLTEKEVFVKETLHITPSMRSFIRICLKPLIQLDPLIELPQKSQDFKYYLDVEDLISNDDIKMTQIEIPSAIQIPKKDDKAYLEEMIESKYDFIWDLDTKGNYALPLAKESDFLIPAIERANLLSDTLTDSFEICPWDISTPKSLRQDYSSDLERFVLNEELDKGLEFRLKALYMTDGPTFAEPRQPFDLIDLEIRFPLYKVPSLPVGSLHDLLRGVDDLQLISEELEICELQILEIEDTVNEPLEEYPYLISAWDPEALQISSNQYDLLAAPKSSPPSSTTPSIDSIRKDTYLKNSYFQLNDSAFNETILSKLGDGTTFEARKMSTSLNDRSENVTTKRTIDEDLDDLVAQKRQRLCKTQRQKKNKFLSPIVSLLLPNSVSSRDYEKIVEDFTFDNVPAEQSKPLLLFENKSCKNLVIFNSSFLSNQTNQDLLKALHSETPLDILEAELGQNDVDFVISSKVGLLILDCLRCQQIDTNNNLVIQERILQNKLRYKNLHVIITCSSLDNGENLLYIQTCLSILDVDVHLTTDATENISQWIQSICQAYGTRREKGEIFEDVSVCIGYLRFEEQTLNLTVFIASRQLPTSLRTQCFIRSKS